MLIRKLKAARVGHDANECSDYQREVSWVAWISFKYPCISKQPSVHSPCSPTLLWMPPQFLVICQRLLMHSDSSNLATLLVSTSGGGLVVSVSTCEAVDPGSIPDSGVADSKRSESRGGYSGAIKMPAFKSS